MVRPQDPRQTSGRGLPIALAAFVAVRCIVPLLPPLSPGLNQMLSISVYVWLVVVLLHVLAQSPMSRGGRAAVLVASLAAWVGLLTLTWGDPLPDPLVRAAQDLCLVIATSSVGALVALVLKESSILVPIVGAAALFDILYVMIGPTQTILTSAPDVALKAAALVPTFGEGHAPGAPDGFLIGPGDLLLIAFLFSACGRFSLRVGQTVVQMGLWMWGALVIVALTGLPLPGWLFLGAAFLVANYGVISLSPEERRMVIVAGVIGLIVLAAGVVWFVLHGPLSPPA